MTINEFLKRLARKVKSTRANAYYAGDGIRLPAERGDHCPISFVAGTKPCHTYTKKGGLTVPVLGLTQRQRDLIVSAADNNIPTRLRTRLAQAVGLE